MSGLALITWAQAMLLSPSPGIRNDYKRVPLGLAREAVEGAHAVESEKTAGGRFWALSEITL